MLQPHPFYVQQPADAQPRPQPEGHPELNTHWVGASHLQIGDKLKQADGTVGMVADVATIQQAQEMFNLTVDEAHTFYVGAEGWLVHNCPTTDAIAIASRAANHDAMVKHVLVQGDMSRLGIRTREQLANFIDEVVAGKDTYVRQLLDGRSAYLDPKTNVVVVLNPNVAYKGTVFRPGDGSARAAQIYFLKTLR